MSERSAKATVPGSKRRREAAPPTPERGEESENREAPKISYASALQKAYSKRVDAVDKRFGLSMGLTKQPRLSTGLLCYDLVLGNGLVPGMSVQLGAEQSAKSTACMTVLRASLAKPIPIRKYFDVEGAVDRRYTGNILGTDSFTDIFGDKNRSGRWIKDPQCLYHDENITETVFRDMHHTAKMLPKKIYREDLQEWFLVFERDTQSIALMKELIKSEAIGSPDKSLFTSTGRYWCSVGDDDSPQAVFFLDSLPMLVPEKVDDDEKGQGLAVGSRVLGEYLKRVRGVLRPKGIMLVCVNQLRAQPMPKPGQPDWYEPAGNATKFACMTGDTRIITTQGMLKASDYVHDVRGEILTTDGLQKPKGFSYMGDKPIVEVRLRSGHLIRCSGDHAILAFGSAWNKSGVHKEEFVKAKDLIKTHYVKVFIGANAWSNEYYKIPTLESNSYCVDHTVLDTTIPTVVDEKLARWMGLLTGDGSYCGKGFTYTSLGVECKFFRDLTEELFGYTLNFRRKNGCWSTGANVWSIKQTLKMLGMTQSGLKKKVPESIFRSPRSVVLEYAAGLFTADGYFGKQVSLCTVSGQLAHDVQLLLNNLGYEVLLKKKKFKGGFGHTSSTGKSRRRWIYSIVFSRESSNRFVQDVCIPKHKLANMYDETKEILYSKGGFPLLFECYCFGAKVKEKLKELKSSNSGFNPYALSKKREKLYSWMESLRTSHERKSVKGDLDRIYGMVDDYMKGYRYYPIDTVEVNHIPEATYDGCMPTEPTIVANGIVCHNSDSRNMFASRVPQDGFPKWKDHGGICAEDSVEFEGGIDLYAFKGITNIKNKYGTPFRKTFARVWYKDGEGEPRGFDPTYDVWKFLHTIGAIEGFQPTTITDKRKKFFVNLKPVMDVEWTWPMFKAQVIAQYDNNRRMMKVAQDLGAPIRFNLRDYCLKLLKSGRTEDMLASHNRKKEKESGGIDMEVESAEE